MYKALRTTLWASLVCMNLAWGQPTARVTQLFFNDFITFYISSVDVTTGSSNMDLFELELAPLGNDPIPMVVEFRIVISSVPLGLTFDDLFLTVTTEEFDLLGPIRVQNRELNTSISGFPYADRPGNVEISGANIESLDFNELDDMLSQIIQSGRLPDGTYRFSLDALDPDTRNSLLVEPWTKDIISAHPIALELISPGGPLEDTTNTEITTTYPFFQWESDPCAICGYQIRVARYIPDEHSSMDDAIEDQTVLPLDQALGYYDAGNATSLQYPLTGAVDLEPGGVYVWQVQKTIPTSVGDETINSFIWALKIKGQERDLLSGPIIDLLRIAMGTERFEQAFDDGGELEGFEPNEVVRLNGEGINLTRVRSISTALQQGEISVITLEVE
ncbi:MAG: hypothetical protein V3U35_06685 [Candidatus Neomarinimicrobiota bacterium]